MTVETTILRLKNNQRRELRHKVVELAAQICSVANNARSDVTLLSELSTQVSSWEDEAGVIDQDTEGFTCGVQKFLCKAAFVVRRRS